MSWKCWGLACFYVWVNHVFLNCLLVVAMLALKNLVESNVFCTSRELSFYWAICRFVKLVWPAEEFQPSNQGDQKRTVNCLKKKTRVFLFSIFYKNHVSYKAHIFVKNLPNMGSLNALYINFKVYFSLCRSLLHPEHSWHTLFVVREREKVLTVLILTTTMRHGECITHTSSSRLVTLRRYLLLLVAVVVWSESCCYERARAGRNDGWNY